MTIGLLRMQRALLASFMALTVSVESLSAALIATRSNMRQLTRSDECSLLAQLATDARPASQTAPGLLDASHFRQEESFPAARDATAAWPDSDSCDIVLAV